ncbi:DUF1464 domain-containing protein [Candidatus Bathyarchaeota archaeon]|nr:MAG: DUF1464 domain-containing protein [Candidatus Bathyarchaeota archaeon]
MRALGIDPGTKSFDLVVIEGEEVIWEGSVETVKVAEKPELLIEKIDEAGSVDVIAGPSGYGVPVTWNNDITDPYMFALEVLLLTRQSDLEMGVKRKELGIKVYEAITKVVAELWVRKLPTCYVPSCILLPTVPVHRKINRLDMGTADKMAVAVLGVYDQASTFGLEYRDVSFILVELGFGYNAVIGVEEGQIVDGLGGTLVPNGFLTIGPIDAEVAVLGHSWVRSDVFHGGIAELCKTYNIEDVLEGFRRGEHPYTTAVRAMLDSIEKAILSMTSSIKKPREIILSGRYSRNEVLRKLLTERVEGIAPVRNLGRMKGSKISKEAAQGYAIVGEGIAGGTFKKLIEHMRIKEASGTVLDWVFHPRLKEAKSWLLKAYKESVRKPRLTSDAK